MPRRESGIFVAGDPRGRHQGQRAGGAVAIGMASSDGSLVLLSIGYQGGDRKADEAFLVAWWG